MATTTKTAIPNLYLANDLVPNMLYRNDGARFVDRGLASGTSLNGAGWLRPGWALTWPMQMATGIWICS